MNKIPTKIQLHKQSQQLELHFGGEQFLLPAEFLRVHSPSAEVKGHGPGQTGIGHPAPQLPVDEVAAANRGNAGGHTGVVCVRECAAGTCVRTHVRVCVRAAAAAAKLVP